MAMRLIWVGYYPLYDFAYNVNNRPLVCGYDDAGNLLYSFPLGYTTPGWPVINATLYPAVIKGDIHCNLYVAPNIDDTLVGTVAEIRKFDCYGNELTTALHHYGAPIKQIETDSSGDVFISGPAVNASGTIYTYPTSGAHARAPSDGYYTLHKFNSSDALVWSVDSGQDYYSGFALGGGRFAIDGNGDVIVSYDYGDNIYGTPYVKRLKKLSGTNGSTIWGPIAYTADHAYNTWTLSTGQITCDSSNNIYCLGFEYTTDYFLCIFKYNSSGVYQSKTVLADSPGYWYENPPYFKMDGSNVLHVTTKAGYYKFNTSLVQTFFSAKVSYETPNGCPAIDSAGGIYYGYPAPTGWYDVGQTYYQLKKFTNTTPTSTLSWAVEAYYPLPKPNGIWASFACMDIVEDCQHPAIPIKLALGLPTWRGDLTIRIPALSIPLALGTPTFLRDYVGPPLPAVYRCLLTGGTGSIDVPLANFQCRRTRTGIEISVTCPALTATQLAAIQARTAGEIVLRRGVRFQDGTEQVDELVRAAFSTLRWDAGSGSASATLTARAAAPAVNSKTRTLQGISYRNLSGGVRRVRCAVDTYLAVGDTADLGGGETLTVAEIVYNISPDAALMEIAEEAA